MPVGQTSPDDIIPDPSSGMVKQTLLDVVKRSHTKAAEMQATRQQQQQQAVQTPAATTIPSDYTQLSVHRTCLAEGLQILVGSDFLQVPKYVDGSPLSQQQQAVPTLKAPSQLSKQLLEKADKQPATEPPASEPSATELTAAEPTVMPGLLTADDDEQTWLPTDAELLLVTAAIGSEVAKKKKRLNVARNCSPLELEEKLRKHREGKHKLLFPWVSVGCNSAV